eukprot:TRINITY_DN4749_c0_g1_i4.p1 TRINITY_DN4749_c0_g1~~TRINITY_DN4749_c0_g1_i4.p1  ORF type:complete len:191 (+),score=61.00 TRINITY_DN4749_c0_g1_i4:92-664(+)
MCIRDRVHTSCVLVPVSNTSMAANCSAFSELLFVTPQSCNTSEQAFGLTSSVAAANCTAVSDGFSCQLPLSAVSSAVCSATEPALYLDTLDNSQAWGLMAAAGMVWLGAAVVLALARCYKKVLNPMKNKTALSRPLVSSEYWREGVYDEVGKIDKYQDTDTLEDDQRFDDTVADDRYYEEEVEGKYQQLL